ncbi:MAG: NADH-quinone oxidoreductase subunit L [Anaerolineae bacterium]|jgi:NADH-quinone oxidoreductase subunit L|nr:NADH-quinone oxidoreductase subunit L [Anaerolineae bacterium]
MTETFFNLTWLIPLFPLAAFALIVLVTNRHRLLSTWVAWVGIGLAWILGWLVLFGARGAARELTPPRGGLALPLYTIPTGGSQLQLGFHVDTLTGLMLFMVPFVCLMIFIYSKGYMNFGTSDVDPRYSRFFAYISLFACGMLGLVISDNFLTLLVFWEIMGLCSYLLIGFWFDKSYSDPNRITPKQAGLKAFLTTRIGDALMMVGIFLLYSQTKTLTFREVFAPETLEQLANTYAFGGVPWATLIALLIFGGAVGKSSQFPLHVWLPDAMEGPTPVSALIHAATMVSAGVYLVARSFPLFVAVEGGLQLQVVAFIGAFTAIFASTIAVAQNDIKRVLAYSTISQLGYMIAALGIGAYVAAVFHLITHAFFKALLFMGSGSVIHGVEHGYHHVHHHAGGPESHEHKEEFDANDMMNMGGLLRRMPATGWTFVIGALALTGIPIWAGFWSKDEILADAWNAFMHGGHFGVSSNWGFIVWLLLTIAAFLTAFYTGRQVFLTFAGRPRTEAAANAPESVPSMTWPLAILAVFATLLGLAGTPWANQFYQMVGEEAEILGEHVAHGEFNPLVAGISIGVALLGWVIAWAIYGRKPLTVPVDPLERPLGPVYTLLKNKYYFDEAYMRFIVRPTISLAHAAFVFDDKVVIDPIVDSVGRFGRWLADWLRRAIDSPVVDGAVNGVGRAMGWMGEFMRATQTGKVQNYLLVAAVTVVLLLALFLVRA